MTATSRTNVQVTCNVKDTPQTYWSGIRVAAVVAASLKCVVALVLSFAHAPVDFLSLSAKVKALLHIARLHSTIVITFYFYRRTAASTFYRSGVSSREGVLRYRASERQRAVDRLSTRQATTLSRRHSFECACASSDDDDSSHRSDANQAVVLPSHVMP